MKNVYKLYTPTINHDLQKKKHTHEEEASKEKDY
jgi:hypothetical protein